MIKSDKEMENNCMHHSKKPPIKLKPYQMTQLRMSFKGLQSCFNYKNRPWKDSNPSQK